MMSTNVEKNREQVQFICMDDLVPKDHLLRLIDGALDWSFIYDLVEDKYSPDNGRPSLDPVVLIKIPLIQYLYGIKSMRQTIKEIEVNVAYRWFLGLDLYSKVVDATHVKARANAKKHQKQIAKQESLFYEEQLKEEINRDREEHGKKPLKDKDDGPSGGTGGGKEKEIKVSTSDPDSGWFHKGEHKQVFAYSVETACDKNGWILGYTVSPGNQHDSRTFKGLYDKMKPLNPNIMIMDAGYKTPAIAKMLIDDGIKPLFPYKCPMTKKGFFRKYQYVYDEYYDCYLCPNDKILKYRTTNRDGYREYKSNPHDCAKCPYIDQCTESQNHQKTVTRHIWEDYVEITEDIRHTIGMKDLYNKRKETIERLFGTAKENHGFRYTQMYGKARMQMKVGLTFACMNLKKLARILKKKGIIPTIFRYFPKNLPIAC